jgi:hypothetical protein
MRGNVYRHGRRRAGSVILALVVALAVALGCASAAAAKPGASHGPLKASRAPHTSVVAHAAGHKIA